MNKVRLGIAALVSFFVGSAHAEPSGIDVSSVTGYLSGDVTDAITAVGLALLALAVVAVGFKWLKGMIFG